MGESFESRARFRPLTMARGGCASPGNRARRGPMRWNPEIPEDRFPPIPGIAVVIATRT